MASNDSTSMVVADGGSIIDNDDVDSSLDDQKSGFFSGGGNVDFLRQITLIMVLAICLAIAVFVVIWANQPDYRILAKLPTEELIKTMDFLDANDYTDYIQDKNVLSVPEGDYQKVKLMLAREGIGEEPNAGTDILMNDMGFGVSQRLERERLQYGREQRLARTIEDLDSISKARVLLAIPRDNIFARTPKNPSATVVVTMKRGKTLSEEEVDSVVDIVASAVQGLSPDRVTVSDQNGRLLNSGSQDSISSRSRKELEIEQKREQEYRAKIDSILIPVVGLGNYTAQVDVSMDFTNAEQTQRRYNPDLPALRSEMTVEDNSVGSVIAGIPGALTNQPPLDSAIPEQAGRGNSRQGTPSRNHKEQTRNYELDESISYVKQQTGVIQKISVSVALDYLNSQSEDGNLTQQPRSAEELANIRRLLQGSIGFDIQRGDQLQVVTIPFKKMEEEVAQVLPIYEQAWFARLSKLVAGVLIIIVLIMAVVRPMLKRLLNPDQTPADYGDRSLDSHLDLGDDAMNMLSQEFDAGAVGFAPDGSLQLPDLKRDEDVLKAVRALVANEPELSSQVVKSWLNEDD